MSNEFDEFTGSEAQTDPEFLQEGGDFSAECLTDIEKMEQELAMGEFDDDQNLQGLDYENFVILKKQEILKFLRAVEPWIKVSVDQYGKCIRIRSLSADEVELSYINNDLAVVAKLPNRSGKTIPEYFMQVTTFKRIITETYASLVLVHENNELNIALLDNILFVETLKLNSEEYHSIEMPDKLTQVDTEALTLVTKKLSFVLSATDRAAEKIINFDGEHAYISTAVFAAVVKNPFQEGSMAISKVCLDLLGVLTEVSKLTFNVAVTDKHMLIEVDGLWKVRIPIYKLDNVLVDKAKDVTGFQGTIEVSNESLIKLVDVTRSFEYLSEVLEFRVSDELHVDVRSKDLTRTVSYHFPFQGTPESLDEVIRVSAAVVKPYLHLGADAKYAFTRQGWGLDTAWGKLLIRKTV